MQNPDGLANTVLAMEPGTAGGAQALRLGYFMFILFISKLVKKILF